MGYREFDITLPTDADDDDLRAALGKLSRLKEFQYTILLKSLDARHKGRIVWRYRCGLSAAGLQGQDAPAEAVLDTPRTGKGRTVLVVGTGPAGICAAVYLARRGFKVSVLERGSRVEDRRQALAAFERGGAFPETNNYAYGEGGAGTFSDGKLSSRTKGINAERNFFYDLLLSCGAPAEIAYLTHPHVGSDRLFDITRRLRQLALELGVSFHFDTKLEDLRIVGNRVAAIQTNKGCFEAEAYILACGHSAFDTYRKLFSRQVPFRIKNFALGCRAEHEQALINRAQWGVDHLPGVKAAEYRLTSQAAGIPVYSFCMCPGGTVVQASAETASSVVNGKSDYLRDGRFANAAVVAGLNLAELLQRAVSPEEALDWLEALERLFKSHTGDFRIPAMTVRDFLDGRSGQSLPAGSYAHGQVAADLAELLPAALVVPLRNGLAEFCRKLCGYDSGVLMGLESKTSAPVQVLRHPDRQYAGYENLYLAGEGSGWAGGIVSSAADGLKMAAALARNL